MQKLISKYTKVNKTIWQFVRYNAEHFWKGVILRFHYYGNPC